MQYRSQFRRHVTVRARANRCDDVNDDSDHNVIDDDHAATHHHVDIDHVHDDVDHDIDDHHDDVAA